jgi:CDP-diacylglycerol--glycerol-3-phosphate 3-phosphatidyltransferase
MSTAEVQTPTPTMVQRGMINTLSLIRVAYAPVLYERLSDTPSEERGWKHAGLTALVAVTDFADGYSSERYGSTDFGAKLDELADKALGNSGMQALRKNGEVPAVHAHINLARDIAVTGLRTMAWLKGRQVPSSKGGKARTAMLLKTLCEADSPLSQERDRLRSGSSHATALAITSGLEYALDYFKAGKEHRPRTEVTARNSKLREVFEPRINRLTTALDEKLPGLQPDHLTGAGNVLVGIAAIMAARKPEKSALATTVFTVGALLDAVDGSLARLKGEKNGSGTTKAGMLGDLLSDRLQEIFVFGALSHIARQHGNRVAADNYALAAMTAALPALYKAEAETQGLVVREGGIGTRVDRSILAGAGIAFNRHRATSDLISAAIADNNVVTAAARREVISEQEEAPYFRGRNDEPGFKEAAEVKRTALRKVAVLGAGVSSVLLGTDRRTFRWSRRSGPARTA